MYRYPRDLSEEVERELLAARHSLVRSELRTTALEQLLELVRSLEAELQRPVALPDLLATAHTAPERERRLALLRSIRSKAVEATPVGERSVSGP